MMLKNLIQESSEESRLRLLFRTTAVPEEECGKAWSGSFRLFLKMSSCSRIVVNISH